MTFHPNMDSQIHGVTLLETLKCRAWPGMIADVWNVECIAGAKGHYVSRAPRLFMLLDSDQETAIDLSTKAGGNETVTIDRSNPLCFIPAEVPIWSHMMRGGRIRHLDIHLDMTALAERFTGRLDRAALETLDLTLSDQRVLSLSRLIAQECCDPSGLDELYGESLASGLLSVLTRLRPETDNQKGRLAPRHLRRVMDYLNEHYARNIALKELADLVGLSPSYFSEAFKNSTGLPPHRWQMIKRVEKAKQMLSERKLTPAEAAMAAGFSDQAHFTRVFRRFEGITPAAWLRQKS